MKRLIFATTNKAKISQLKFVANYLNIPIEITSPKELFGNYEPYDEIGASVQEIALNGAMSIARNINLPVITEDSSFKISSMPNELGVKAGEFLKTFGRGEILKRMTDSSDRKAWINSAVAYATPTGLHKTFFNEIEGEISKEERFGNFPDWIAPTPENRFGGGFNAIFIPNGLNKTLAEISPTESIPWSYREKNFTDVLKYISNLN